MNNKTDWKILLKPTPGTQNPELTRPAEGSILIVEVNPNSPITDYAKIHCSTGPVDISNFKLTDMDGLDHRLAEQPVTLKTGEEVTIWWARGQDETDKEGDVNGNGKKDGHRAPAFRTIPPARDQEELRQVGLS